MAISSQESIRLTGIIRENQIDFLYDLYQKGLPLSPEKMQILRDKGLLDEPDRDNTKTVYQENKGRWFKETTIKKEGAREAEDMMIIVDEKDAPGDWVSVMDLDELEGIKKTAKFEGGKSITKADWVPKSLLYHEDDFIAWIDSINSGFHKMIRYKKFELYVQQAKEWYAENDSMANYGSREEKINYAYSEFDRIRENGLYFLNKYLKIKEADMVSGIMTYDAKPVHEVIAYLFDCGYNTEVGKPRQIAATTTYGGLALCKIIASRNFFIKFIAQSDDKVQEIFDDKVKYPFSELPDWMKPSVANDRDNILRFAVKKDKGSKKGLNSKIVVVPPSVAAINGGAPNLVMIDEAGYIGMLGKMIREARPTLFREDPQTKKLKMIRQIIIWGTGGEMDKGGKAYETEYFNTWDKWNKREFSYGIIPIFFDWTTRPAVTKEHYENEKKNYTSEGPDKEEKMVQFRQAYPSNVHDMFLTSHKTLVSIDYIQKSLERIQDLPQKHKAIYGYFEPVFDTTKPSSENDDVPYKIIDVLFIPLEEGDSKASTIMFMEPKRNWVNRYCSGTDPIATDNGFSKMAKTIWDRHFKTISCAVLYRDSNHKSTFLQCMLAGMYYKCKYDNEVAPPEVVEANIGTAYVDYLDAKGLYNTLVYRTQLPDYLRGGQHLIGIDNKGNRTKMIINKLYEMILSYGDNIWIEELFRQLRTFICTVNDKGFETWGTQDRRKWFDDLLFSSVFAYICDLVLESEGKTPKEIKSESDIYKTRYVLKRVGHSLMRVPEKVKSI